MKSYKLIIGALVVAVAAGVAVYGCRRAAKTEFPAEVRAVTAEVTPDLAPDHIIVIGFGVDKPVLDNVAAANVGVVEFFAATDQNVDLMMQLGVETLPTVLFVKPGGEIGERLIGDFTVEDITAAINDIRSEYDIEK